jgi:hypothetical protein
VGNGPVGGVDKLGLFTLKALLDQDIVYTCNCGFIDKSHVRSYASVYKRVFTEISTKKKGSVLLFSHTPTPAGTKARQLAAALKQPTTPEGLWREYKYDYSQTKKFDPYQATAELLYRYAYQEEEDQGTVQSKLRRRFMTSFAYEDMASDAVGVLVGQEMMKSSVPYSTAWATVLKNCVQVTDEGALTKMYDANCKPSGKMFENPVMWAVVKGATQPALKCDPCANMKFKPYKDWTWIAGIFSGTDPSPNKKKTPSGTDASDEPETVADDSIEYSEYDY